MAIDGREGGYIKLYRRLESWSLWEAMSALQRIVWVQILISANWKDREAWYGSKTYTVLRGQLSLSEAEIAKRAKVSRQVVRDTIARLIREGSITRHQALPGNQAPWIITIVNYEKFQGVDDEESPQKNQPRTNEEPAESPPRALREEGEEGKKGKNLSHGRRRAPLLGVGSPAFEALEHWNKTVWPALAGCAASSPSPHQVQALGDLCSVHGTAEVKARMDRAAADPFWKSRLTLDDIVDRFDRFAPRTAEAKQSVTAAASDHSKFGKGEVAL